MEGFFCAKGTLLRYIHVMYLEEYTKIATSSVPIVRE